MQATQLKPGKITAIPGENLSRRPSKKMVYNSMQQVRAAKVVAQTNNKPGPAFSSMGLVIPFHPCMWDEKTIHSVWDNALAMVQTKLKLTYNKDYTQQLITRLKKIFNQINLNTHRKSLAIILTPREEKLIYLNFPVKPAVISGKEVSALDLAFNQKGEADFYCLVLNDNRVVLYDYTGTNLNKVYENINETKPVVLFKNVTGIIKLLNPGYEKPVFVAGTPQQMEQFYNSPYYLKQYFNLSDHPEFVNNENNPSLVKEIVSHWSYWNSKFIEGKLMTAQNSNGIINNTEAVLHALRKSTDGLLLIDKRLKPQLRQTATGKSVFHTVDEFIKQVEKFLARGNHIQITQTGMLKNLGGIVLLHNAASKASVTEPYKRKSNTNGLLF
ncbi:MAG TPA: hypothetical protein VLR49_03260 [Ferruginibacter sp.]|nr:hypothetical protein [Ferruginibacter sp.]